MVGEMERHCSSSQPQELQQLLTEPQLQRKRSVVRRFIALCVIGLLLRTALPLSVPSVFLVNIEGDVNRVIALGCLLGGLFVSALLSPLVLRVVGDKRVAMAGAVGAALCVSCRFHASLAFVVPGFLLGGLLLGPCLTVLWTRVVAFGEEHAIIVGADCSKTVVLFSGIFQTWVLAGAWFAQLLSMVFLDFPWISDPTKSNDSAVDTCGVHYCWEDFVQSPSFTVEPEAVARAMGHRVQALLGCSMTFAVAALLFALFAVDRLKYDQDERSRCLAAASTPLLLKLSEFRLVVPVLVLSGARQHMAYQFIVQVWPPIDKYQ
jgi:hypothetical protein